MPCKLGHQRRQNEQIPVVRHSGMLHTYHKKARFLLSWETRSNMFMHSETSFWIPSYRCK